MKIRGWITWPDRYAEGWCECSLVLENGFSPYGHLCSNPSFAYGDLWGRREERQKEWERLGLELDIVGQVPNSEIPKEVLERHQKEEYIEFYEKYFKKSEEK